MSKPTPEQQQAANPAHSVWVSASAGTGKTRVLVNRLLRLMLAGSAPEKLLCITFTKAAAAEVLQRVQQEVLKWSIAPLAELKDLLAELLEHAPSAQQIKRARRLLPVILQSPGGMKIMTIHAFCQSVLARFPLEAQVSPGFAVADDAQSRALLDQAKYQLLDETTAQNNPELFQNLARFFDRVDEKSQNNLIQGVLLKRYRLQEFFRRHHGDFNAVKQVICQMIGITESQLAEDRCEIFLHAIPCDDLKRIIPELMQGTGKTPGKNADKIGQWLAGNRDIKNYCDIFLTAENTKRRDLGTGLNKAPAWVAEFLENEAQRVFDHIETGNKIDLALDTLCLLHTCLEIITRYQELKRVQSVLDYEDQIILTAQLLQNPLDSQWVHYKLDGGIDHILVDEAQDTSPAQWDIIKGITIDFFTGHGRSETGERSLFVVGDEKQSIFSFQNADPVEFSRARAFFAEKSAENKTPWQDISLIDNFRSAPLILKLTDQVFSDTKLAGYISQQEQAIAHHAFHGGRAAEIELWPLLPRPDKENTAYNARNEILLAEKIAEKVQLLLAEDRNLRPGDIMILVRKRNPLVGPLNKAFKDRSIPVASADRLVLKDQLAVQDCLMAIQACLHHLNDYALACFLKSPFIGMDEAGLYTLAIGRTDSLWECLLASEHKDVVAYIERLSAGVSIMPPGPFIHALLSHPCPADRRSGRHGLVRRLGYDCDDVLDELLLTAYEFEANHDGSAQAFVTWMQNDESVIMRANSEMDKSRVQIMTVHAAKGLQAPIVFLADAQSKPENYNALRDVIWLENALKGFVWGMGDARKTPVFKAEKIRHTALQFSEYYRLLYVALTRAESRLIICGREPKSQSHHEFPSWYESVKLAVGALSAHENYSAEDIPFSNQILIRLAQAGENAAQKKDPGKNTGKTDIPKELLIAPEAEIKRLRPLRPSRSPDQEMPVFSPLQPQKNDSYKRGQILHSLFRLIPDYPPGQQEEFLQNLLHHHVDDPVEQTAMAAEVLKVLRHETFAHLFTANAKAEVPVVGEVIIDGENYAVRGQIDRLLVENNRVLIVDYKTNRPPVLDAEKIPAAYRYQLRAYAALMQKIYPDRKIETAILWTSIPYLLPVSV